MIMQAFMLVLISYCFAFSSGIESRHEVLRSNLKVFDKLSEGYYPYSADDFSISEIDIKIAKYRRKYKQLVDTLNDYQPFEKQLKRDALTLVSSAKNYQSPLVVVGEHSFLYRLTYF